MRFRLITLLAAVLMLLFAPAAQASEQTGTVTVVHGIPFGPSGFPVDVYANGDPILVAFNPKTVTQPLELPAGSYNVEIFPTGADPEAEDPTIAGSANLEAGANVSLVAHLDADANPTLGVFTNDISTLAAGQARLTVRYVAVARDVEIVDIVDILADGTRLFEGLENGDESVADLPAGDIEVAVVPAGGTEPLPPLEGTVKLAEGVNTIVYAVGQLGDGEDSLDLLVQTIAGLHQAPTGVESGLGGLKAAEQQRAAQAALAVVLTSIALAGAGVVARISRR
jgi:hypothetical protein